MKTYVVLAVSTDGNHSIWSHTFPSEDAAMQAADWLKEMGFEVLVIPQSLGSS